MRAVLLVCLIIASATADTVVLNGLIDQLLDSARILVNEGKLDEIKIPDMNNKLHTKLLFVKVGARCNCHDGWLRSLASIKRTGDATLTTEGSKVALRVKLGFGKLELGYKKCQAKSRLGKISAKFEAHVESNSVDLQLSVTGQGAHCVAAVDHINADNIGKIKIKTGGGFFHKMEDKIITWVVKHFHKEIVKRINEELSKVASRAIPKLDLCSKIPH